MTCYRKSTLNAINTTAQALTANSLVAFNSANVTGQSIAFTAGTTPATLQKAGLYLVTFSANLLGTAAGNVTLQLLNNNNAIAGASATVTTADATEYTASITTIIEVPCTCPCTPTANNVNVQLQVQTTGVTVNTADLVIVKLA
ncbi:MAG: BclA C-terminal domain protein [Bacteriophage sp.]|nr:MAG: BclA C-terminal domain protein [Bacteriophage sp.]